jgi:hypothetical protein
MLPSDLFWKELMEDWKGKRSLALKLLLPLIFLIPVSIPSVPVQVKASMLPLAVLFLGVFGSAIGLVKMREGRMLPRLAILPLPPYRLMIQYLAANIAMDSLQLVVLFAATILILGVGGTTLVIAGGALVLAIVASNSLGALVAVMAGSSGEVHLLAALTVLIVGGASGLFISGGPSAWASTILPFASLSFAMASSVNLSALVLTTLFSGAIMALTLVSSRRFFYCEGR